MINIKLTLAAARVNAGLTQQQAAEKLGMTRQLLMRIERGDRPPKKIELIAMAQLYGIPESAFSCQHN